MSLFRAWRMRRRRIWQARLAGYQTKLAAFLEAPWETPSATTAKVRTGLHRKIAICRYKIEVHTRMLGPSLTEAKALQLPPPAGGRHE